MFNSKLINFTLTMFKVINLILAGGKSKCRPFVFQIDTNQTA